MAMKVFCKHCGKGNMAGTENCTDCGKRLPTGKTKIIKKEDLPDIPSLRDKITRGPIGMWKSETTPQPPPPSAEPPEPRASPLPPSPRFVKCPSSKHRNRQTSRFCNECGAKLEGARRDSGPVTVIKDVPDWMTLTEEKKDSPPPPDPAALPPLDEILPETPVPAVSESPPPPDPASLPPLVPEAPPEAPAPEAAPVPEAAPELAAPAAPESSPLPDAKDHRITPRPRRGPEEQTHREHAVSCSECNTLNVRYTHCVDCGAALEK
jgi:hypothetical protein